MIPRNDIVAWSVDHPWPEFDQVEQDLLLSQAICAIANDALLADELALRGGTALHKMFLPQPCRYSEDLDYVRSTEGGIGPIMRELTDLGGRLGFKVSTRMGKFPKVFWKYTAESGLSAKIKIEIDTFERAPMLGFNGIMHDVNSQYCAAKALVRSFHPEELIATKLRALYQRSKGRDLYDIWLALTVLNLDPASIVDAFPAYRPDGLSRGSFLSNLRVKLEDPMFVGDVSKLVRSDAPDYNVGDAAELVMNELIARL